MRSFEILSMFLCTALLQYYHFGRKSGIRTAVALSTAAAASLAAHFIFEGYRWQLIPVYFLTFLLVVMILCPSIKTAFKNEGPKDKTATKSSGKLRMNIFCTLMALGILLSAGLALLLPVFNLPKPNGPYMVGTETFHFTDPKRAETLTTAPGDQRELMVRIVYPAQRQKNPKYAALFPQNGSVFRKCIQAYAGRFNLPSFLIDYWKYIRTNSIENAGLQSAERPWPVVLICHGMGTGGVLHAAQAENLASHGFIVVVPDHTYSTTATVFPDERVTGFKTEMNLQNLNEISKKVGTIWLQDVNFLVKQLGRLNSGAIKSKFKGNIDMNNIGIMGHSFGGSTAFSALNLNSSIKAAIDMDGSFFTLDGNYTAKKPFLFITTEDYYDRGKIFTRKTLSDEELKANHLTRESYGILKPFMDSERALVEKVKRNGGYILYVKGTEHFNFTDFQLYTGLSRYMGMTGSINGKRGERVINEYTLDFFNKYLKGTGGQLLEGPNAKYPEVLYTKN